MDTLADYSAWKAKQQQAGVAAANVVLSTVEASPDEAAGDLNLANEFGKVTGNPVPPAPLVKEYRNVFQQRIEEERNKTILSSSPRLTEWLRNPENATVARDDLQNLSWWETALGATANALGRGVRRLPQSFNQYMAETSATTAADQRRTAGEIYADATAIRDGKGNVIGQSWVPGPGQLFSFVDRLTNARSPLFEQQDMGQVAAQYQQQAGQIAKRIAEIPLSPAGSRFRDAFMSGDAQGSAWDQVKDFAVKFAADPGGALAFLTETAIESTPSIAAATAVTATTRNPTLGAIAMGGQSYAQERYTSPVEFFNSKGIDISTPEGVQRVMSDQALIAEAAQRGETRGLIIGLLDGVSGGVAGQALAKSPVGNMVLQSVAQAVMGGSGEALAQLATDGKVDMREVIVEALAEFVTSPAEVAGMSFDRFREARVKARRADVSAKAIGDISTQSQASALRNRLPDKFRQFVEGATANGPVENVYIPADQFATYFQGIGVDPFSLVDELDGVTRDDLETALAGGGDLQIPTATYAAKIAGTAADPFFMENMRFDPNEFTAREAAEFNARADEIMQEAWDAAEAVRVEQELSQSHEQEIYDAMVSRLRTAGRSTDVATNEAMLYPAFYRAMAERSGMTIDDFMRRYPLPEVKGSLPEGMQFKTTDELNRTLAEARARRAVEVKRGPTLLEWISDYGGINDPGGELKSRDAETVKRGRGKKALKLARSGVVAGMADMFKGGSGKKHGVDDVARAAIEAGYLANSPVANEYRHAMETGGQVPDIGRALFEAIDNELRGTPEYAGTTSAKDDQNAMLDSIEEYLSSLGVSLENSDEEIRAAIEGARQYAQTSPPLLFQRNETDARGSIQFLPDGQSIMRLFETANLSTVLHESGHFFLTVMQDMAAKGETSAATDFEAVKAWWRENAAAVAADARRSMPDVKVTKEDVIRALDTGSTGDVMLDGAIDVGMQEQWARGFEQYLMEGKAPSVELRGAFEKFRAWLVSIYKRLAGLNVTISDDIRGVMDRMLATDQEISKAKAETGDVGPLFASAEQMGLTPEEYSSFMKLRTQGEDEAKARLLREIMEPVKREQEKAYKAEKAKVREEVAREVNAYPYYRAWEWMGNRRWIGEGQPIDIPDMRLSKSILVDRYGAGVLDTLPRGKQTIYAVDGGVDPDDAAGWFGFGSGDEMIRALERAPKRGEAIDAETDRVMRERHGDALNDGSIEAHALDAVHTDKRGQWIAAELKAVVEVAGTGTALTAKEARATARDTISRMRVRDAMNANRFLSAERKAADEAARLGAILAREGVWMQNARRRIATKARAAVRGDASADAVPMQIEQANRSTGNYNETVAALIDAKRRQLLNHALYQEARKVTEEVEKAERYVAKLGKASTRERIAGAGRRENANVDYLAAIDELLEQYDFRRISGAAEQRRGALNAFIDAMKAAGRENELAIPDKVLSDAARKPYKTVPVDELRGVIDSLKNLEHIATRWDKLIDAQNERILDETVNGIADAIDKNLPKRPPGPVKTKGEQARNTVRAYFDSVLNATTLLREIDGFADRGAAYLGLKAPIDEAQNRLIVRKKAAAEKLEQLYSVYSKEERRAMAVRSYVPELKMSLSKWERIAIALNTGNEGNLTRLTDGRSRRAFTLDQVKAVLASLDARDADFIQSVWDYIGSFKADIAARERRVTGVEPQWVEPSPAMIGGKELRGGYYPIKYDTRLSSAAADRESADIAASLVAGKFGKAQTRNGHLKERAAAGDGSIDLDMAVMHRHVNEVIYDLEMSEPVANAWRVLQDGRVRSALDDAGRSADFDALQAWLQDAGQGELGASSAIGGVMRGLKSNFTAAKLAFNISNALLQISGVAQSFVVVGKKDMAIGIAKTAANPFEVAKQVAAKSPFMESRQTTFNKDIMDFYVDPRQGMNASRLGEFKRNIWGPLSFWLMQKAQWHFADVPTWVAGYHQGLRKFGGDDAKAVAHADSLVKRAQASGLWIDRTGVERGSLRSGKGRQNDFIKLFSTLGSYMFAKFNVAYERSAVASRDIRQSGVSFQSAQTAASWTLDMMLLFTLEALVAAAIKGGLPGGDDEDDEGWLKWLATKTALSAFGTLPFIRDIAPVLEGYGGGGAYGSIIGDLGKGLLSANNVKNAASSSDEDVEMKDVKAIINATGVVTGAPTVFTNRIVDAGWRQMEGEDVSPLEYIFGKPKK